MKTTIYQQHQDHTEWLNKLSFYEDEIVVLKKRLEEMVQKNNSKDVLANVEHFQNQFIIQKENIDILKHDIRQDEKKIQANINANSVASDHRKTEDHVDERERLDTFEKNFNDLRKEFDKFLAKWM